MFEKVICWDFDGTLAYRKSIFIKSLLDACIKNNISITESTVRDNFIYELPWSIAVEKNIYSSSESWWEYVNLILKKILIKMNVRNSKHTLILKDAYEHIIKEEFYILYDDTLCVLSKFSKENKYFNLILSNHIPELPIICKKIGINKYLGACFSSANLGREKPDKSIFEIIMKSFYAKEFWMIGDNFANDIAPAKNLGFKTVHINNKYVSDGVYTNDIIKTIYLIKE